MRTKKLKEKEKNFSVYISISENRQCAPAQARLNKRVGFVRFSLSAIVRYAPIPEFIALKVILPPTHTHPPRNNEAL